MGAASFSLTETNTLFQAWVKRGLAVLTESWGACLELSLQIQQLVVINRNEAQPVTDLKAWSPQQVPFTIACQRFSVYCMRSHGANLQFTVSL